jgi:3-deoxy-D-manno-octulosonate 8-phosphate phosphatase (KDO 8-P phosphatase)
MDEAVRHAAARVKLLGLDVDGVLTDGGVYVLEDGTEFRRFYIKDGLGLKQVMRSGIEIAIISASSARPIIHRARHLGITRLHLGAVDKLATLQTICHELALSLDQVAYMGDDLADLDVMHAVGLPCAPADAVQRIREAALVVTELGGGHGAVRELCDLLVSVHNTPHG